MPAPILELMPILKSDYCWKSLMALGRSRLADVPFVICEPKDPTPRFIVGSMPAAFLLVMDFYKPFIRNKVE